MLWSRDSCKHVVIYDSTDISWTGIECPEDVKFKVSSLQIGKDMLQAIAQCMIYFNIIQRVSVLGTTPLEHKTLELLRDKPFWSQS